MKTILFTIAFVLCAFTSVSAQDVLYSVKLQEKQVPATIITAVKKDYADVKIFGYAAVPVSLIKDSGVVFYDQDKMDNVEYDSYIVTMVTPEGTVQANYDHNGKLIGTATHMKNVALPPAVRKSVGTSFPGWAVAGDHMVVNTKEKGVAKDQYRVKLTKDGEHRTVTLGADGELKSTGREHRERGKREGKRVAPMGKNK